MCPVNTNIELSIISHINIAFYTSHIIATLEKRCKQNSSIWLPKLFFFNLSEQPELLLNMKQSSMGLQNI
ncbi:hypothetical protein JHK85_027367 [Glycine max]|nr:hypothetical protein JHK85_027367 [Glycine max]KHN03802.1 hypothetical protein glysoja_011031 [Glycine soja]